MSQTIDGGGNPASFPDIHKTDGKLAKYAIKTRFSINDKHQLISTLIDLIKEKSHPSIREFGVQGLLLIAKDAGMPPNWQGADQLFADDIVAEICSLLVRVNDAEIINTSINHIAEQMADMLRTCGTCPSGRVNRLFQIYMPLKDYVDGVHLPSNNNH